MSKSCCAFLLCVAASLPVALAVEKKPDPTPAEIQDIVKRFTQKETDFAVAREVYTYRQSVKLTETEPPGGTYEMVEDVSFDDHDRRISHVTFAPVNGLQVIGLTREDEQDLANIFPFVFTNDSRDQYDVTYVGREAVDEISCYVFSIKPKELTKDRKRYFEGQAWVDDQDLQIVKTYGRPTGALHRGEDQQFLKFETYREQIDGKFWFPVYTYADDTLNFKNGPSQRAKLVVKYDHYKKYQFKTESTIKYGDVGAAPPTGPGGNKPAPPPSK